MQQEQNTNISQSKNQTNISINIPQQQPITFSFNAPQQQQQNTQQESINSFAPQTNYNFNPVLKFPPQQQQIPSQKIQQFPIYQQQQQYLPQPQQFNSPVIYQNLAYSPQQIPFDPFSNNNNSIPPPPYFLPNTSTTFLRLLNNYQHEQQKEVVAVIVTINGNFSYDHLFAQVEQKSQEGTRVLVYEASTTYIDNFIKAYEGNPVDNVAKEMMEHISKLHPDCVVFNWECCGAYATKHFHEGKENVFKFLKIILDKGHMAMFSDFSLKALIEDWDSTLLGPNPFIQTTETSTPIEMKFNPGQLKECPSAQLQIIGEMAENGTCHINVMGGTIVYCVNKETLNHNFYQLKVLSVSTNTLSPGVEERLISSVDGNKGTACHILLTYPSGGMILTSMGHWIELMKVDTSDKKLFEVAEQNFGAGYAAQMKMEYSSLDVNEQKAWVSKNAVNFVQNQAPCSNMSKKMKY